MTDLNDQDIDEHIQVEDGSKKNSEAQLEDANGGSDAEEEDECRVCRGPAEEGRPLFAPCKCSGSIGLTHQDCLMSWLEVTRGDGRCELCKTKFRFDPQYAENAPESLPAHEVLLGLCSRAVAKWLPLALRVLIAASLWLLVAPFLTSCLYHGWMHRPSSVLTRWKRELIAADIVSGAILVSVIIISFLSLMSFADFLRVHWQQQPRNDEQQRRRQDIANGFAGDDNVNNEGQGGIDDAIIEHIEMNRPLLDQDPQDSKKPTMDYEHDIAGMDNDMLETQAAIGHELAMLREARQQHPQGDRNVINDLGNEQNRDGLEREEHDEGSWDEGSDNDERVPLVRPRGLVRDEEDERSDADDEDVDGIEIDRDDDIVFAPEPIDAPVERPFDPMDPVLQDDQVDMEINVALDELLGLRGPLSALVRNLLWLLAFNATYLGIFAFVPRTVGSVVYAGVFNTTLTSRMLKVLPYVYSDEPEDTTVLGTISSLNAESMRKDTTFRLPDVATVTLGYFSISMMIIMMKYGWAVSQRIRQHFSLEGTHLSTSERDVPTAVLFQDPVNRDNQELDEREGEPEAASTAVGVALDATVAVVKVGVLLFLKMFFLPLVLGLWLDASTMSLFGHSLSDRVSFAGGDLFSFVLLHWVAGITFMLLVTVFLLQLREVAHPDLLARLIRPQEPQPDLLGNLMHEAVGTHMKRMFLSLGIYAPLLTMHVTLPVKLLIASGLTNRFTFFHLNFWHILMPQMQIPLELIIFHLSMLALLERYKNSIGNLQHTWMVFMCRQMGLTKYLLPLSVSKFELIGTKRVFLSGADASKSIEVDPFWYELLQRTSELDSFVESNIEKTTESRYVDGEVKEDGERVLKTSVDFIRLPMPSKKDSTSIQTGEKKHLLPTRIGRFRFNLCGFDTGSNAYIEVWREVYGDEIPRPPEGWDDLGAGGAFVQGRWAWGKERRSTIEGSVAQRTPFRPSESQRRPMNLMLKGLALLVLSWIAITLTVLGFVSAPLAVGRSLYYIFRVPEKYVHDPLAFVVGGCIFFPLMSLVLRIVKTSDGNLVVRLLRWISRFRFPPRRKFVIIFEALFLWFFVAPLALGISYEISVVKTSKWFAGEERIADLQSLFLCWMVGVVVLHAWASGAYYSVFTKTFWTSIGNGFLEPPLEENLAARAARIDDRNGMNGPQGNVPQPGARVNEVVLDWQGVEGRVSRFVGVCAEAMFGCEWDKVDRRYLLDEFARPITKQLASALVGASLSFQFTLSFLTILMRSEHGGILVPFVGVVDRGVFRLILFRFCMATHLTLQLCSAFRARLESWFQAAHAAARDDRYLIGEVLMNYNPDEH